jgi:membrane protease YdiL (CAAX protease family)
LVFVALNAVFGIYTAYLWRTGTMRTYHGLSPWQIVFLLSVTPLTAGLVEECIWRGYIIPSVETRGRARWAAILLSSISFALIHGVFLPIRLLVTFVWGVIAGFYYTRERTLVPLIVTHVVVDVWSFGLLLIA